MTTSSNEQASDQLAAANAALAEAEDLLEKADLARKADPENATLDEEYWQAYGRVQSAFGRLSIAANDVCHVLDRADEEIEPF